MEEREPGALAAPPPAAATTTEVIAAMPEWNGPHRITLLLLGVDRRDADISRSDTMILLNIDTLTKRAGMLSIPRDLKVMVPGYGIQKMNAAYAFGEVNDEPGGGPGLTMRTIEANFGLRVDHFAEVDFAGFQQIVDTVGGLTLNVPYPIKDDAYPGPGNQYMRIYFVAGWQWMDGERVLQYARTRHDDGDTSRSRRQQQVLLALREQAIDLDLLPKAAQLIADFGGTVRTDIEPAEALALARLAAEIDPAQIQQYSLSEALAEEELPDQPYYLVADWAVVGTILSQFTGATIVPPMSAVANADLARPLTIVDSSGNPGLGDRVAALLRAQGFTDITVEAAAEGETTSLTARDSDLTTAYLVAGLVGVPLESIQVATPSAASPSPITIALGPDAADPATFLDAPLVQELGASGATEAGDPAVAEPAVAPTDDWLPVSDESESDPSAP
jgi:LCP family protein required for cell wall assembly